MRRVLQAFCGALIALLALPAAALARGGGGSFHFGGGGGGRGFGGGGRGFGGGHFLFFGGGFGLILAIVAIVLVFVLVSYLKREAIAARYRARRRRRTERVRLAAAEATEDDPDFAPEVVVNAAKGLFRGIQGAWDARDRPTLAKVMGPELLAEWQRRLDGFDSKGWHNRVEVVGPVEVDYIGLVNRAADEDDRVIVRIETRLRDYVVGRNGRRVPRTDNSLNDVGPVAEYWTLGKRDGGWILLSIEQDKEGEHQLDEPLVASPWADDKALHDEAVVEGAQAERLPAGTAVREIADLQFEGTARQAALDLSLADGRFAPAVLEVAVRRAVEGWSEAVDGPDDRLLAVATAAAAQQMLHPGDPSGRTRLVVRGPRVKRLTITRLDAGSEPPALTVELEVSGRRYVEDRQTMEITSGSQQRETTWVESWRLDLDGDAENPWKIAALAAR